MIYVYVNKDSFDGLIIYQIGDILPRKIKVFFNVFHNNISFCYGHNI